MKDTFRHLEIHPTMEKHNIEKRVQSLDHISQGNETEKRLRRSVALVHEQDESDRLPRPEALPITQWNHPRINIWRTLTAFLGFFILGAHDGAYGVKLNLSSTTTRHC